MRIEVTNSRGERKQVAAQVVRDRDLVTTVLIPFLMDGAKAVAFGRAFRCEKDKQPNKKLARIIAAGRAVKVIERSMGPKTTTLGIPLCTKTLKSAELRYGFPYVGAAECLISGGLKFVGDSDAFSSMSADEIMVGGQLKDDRFAEL